MPSLLEQAIIDAKELREAALRFAENQVIEKHASELKGAIDSFLNEQEEPMDVLPSSASPELDTVPEEIPDAPTVSKEETVKVPVEVEFTVDDLANYLKQYEEEQAKNEPPAKEVDLGSMEKQTPEDSGLMEEVRRFMNETESIELNEEEELDEAFELDEEEEIEEDLHSLVEELVVDIMNGQRDGDWAGRPETDRQEQEKVNLARLADTKRQQELKDLQDGMKKLAGVNESLKNQNTVLNETVSALKNKLEHLNLSNAKLLYQNEVLTNASLNERQKTQVVESIRKAQTVTEAKVIFETLQSAAAAGATSTGRKLESLHEAINRPSRTFPVKRNSVPDADLGQFDYWKKLAGIQK